MVLSYLVSCLPLIGEGIDPVKMVSYAVRLGNADESSRCPLWFPGVGDHGGGPTRDMLRCKTLAMNSLPRLEFVPTSLKSIYNTLAALGGSNGGVRGQVLTSGDEGRGQEIPSPLFPVWEDELYLEFHRGCYNSCRLSKALNHVVKGLYQAELSVFGNFELGIYPKLICQLPGKVLFNQFDIFNGFFDSQPFVG